MRALTKDEVGFVSGGWLHHTPGESWGDPPGPSGSGSLAAGGAVGGVIRWLGKLIRDGLAWDIGTGAAGEAYSRSNINMGTCPTGWVKQTNGTCLQFSAGGGFTTGAPGNGAGKPVY